MIVDSYEAIKKLDLNKDWLKYWRNYAHLIHPCLELKCLEEYEKNTEHARVIQLMRNALSDEIRLENLHRAFMVVTKSASFQYKKIFDKELPDIYFYLGLGCGAGWVTEIERKWTILLGVEMILDIGWDREKNLERLLCHELCHAIHYDFRGKYEDEEDNFWQLYEEGFASYYEGYLSGTEELGDKYQKGWLDWNKKNKSRMAKLFLDTAETEEGKRFFGNWRNIEGYSDIGYYLGSEIIKKLEESMTMKEIATLPKELVKKTMIEVLLSFASDL